MPLQGMGRMCGKQGERESVGICSGGLARLGIEVALRVAAPAILRLPPERSR